MGADISDRLIDAGFPRTKKIANRKRSRQLVDANRDSRELVVIFCLEQDHFSSQRGKIELNRRRVERFFLGESCHQVDGGCLSDGGHFEDLLNGRTAKVNGEHLHHARSPEAVDENDKPFLPCLGNREKFAALNAAIHADREDFFQLDGKRTAVFHLRGKRSVDRLFVRIH